MNFNPKPLEVQEQFLAAAFQVLKVSHETLLNSALTTAGFVNFLQEQVQSQWKELLNQSDALRKANLEKLQSLVQESHELNHTFYQNLQELTKYSLQAAASLNPFLSSPRTDN